MKIKLAENIKKFRKEHSFTQEQLAEALGVTVGAVYKWEAGLSMPEIRLIMELADVFEVSVDVLLGYEQQNENVENRIGRIEQCMREKNFEEGVTEVEKALQKYPNHFEVVYVSGLLYQLKFIEEKDAGCIERSNMLLQRAITLLYQNEDKQINEVTILNMIAQNYLLLEKTDQALESLKQNNVCGINNSLIGMTYARTLRQPKEARPYLVKSLADCLGDFIRTMTGMAYMYAEAKDRRRSIDAIRWLEGMLDSMKADCSKLAFTDQIKAALWAQSAIWEAEAGCRDAACVEPQNKSKASGHIEITDEHRKRAEELLKKAHTLAVQFDSAPVYNLEGLRFFEEEAEEGIAYIDIGSTAIEAVENILYEDAVENEAYEYVHSIWEQLREKENDAVCAFPEAGGENENGND